MNATRKKSGAERTTRKASGPEQIRELYDQGMRQVMQVLGSVKSTDEEIEIAEQSMKDLTRNMLAHEVESVQGRTALLSGLIVELTTVIDSIEDSSPLAKVTKELTDIVDVAKTALSDEKGKLLA